MMNLMKAVLRKKLLFTTIVCFLISGFSSVHAGEDGKKKEYTEEDIKREISFWAKKLLDMKGEKTLTIRSSSLVKPFIGVCNSVDEQGVKLTCITPESQADKNGLKTGDLVVAINGISMTGKDGSKKDHGYWDIVNNMKTGDLLKMDIIRSGEPQTIDVNVGALSQPAFVCEIGS